MKERATCDDLDALKTLVHQRCGLQFDGLARPRLERAVNALKVTTGLDSNTALLALLRRDERQFDALISHLTVNETYFFRELDALHWLVEHFLPRRLAEKGAPVAILSAGCSSGEEPYSLAMLLYERFGEQTHTLFTLTGGDVDRGVLDKARRGYYAGMAFRALSPAVRDRYFTPAQSCFRLNDRIRRLVTFLPFNVLDARVQTTNAYDVILFRNVSIYFDTPTLRHIQRRLRDHLAPDGILLCGVTEVLGNDLGEMPLCEDQGIFYFQPQASCSASPPTSPPASPPTSAPTPPLSPLPQEASAAVDATPSPASVAPATPTAPPSLDTLRQCLAEGDLSRADALVALRLAAKLDQTEQQATALCQAYLAFQRNAFQDAAKRLDTLLTEQPWWVDARIYAGLAARWQQDTEAASRHFKYAIYSAPESWPAHFYQAELARKGTSANDTGDVRGYATVVRILTTNPTANGGLTLLPPPLPPGDARFLAVRRLSTSTTERAGG
jgi:chemotaxis protein methyltransferase CheR